MAGNSESAIKVSAQLSAKQLMGVTFAAISSVLVGALYIATWSVERSINDIEQKIVDVSNTTSALIDKLESTLGREIAALEVELETLVSIVNEQEKKLFRKKRPLCADPTWSRLYRAGTIRCPAHLSN